MASQKEELKKNRRRRLNWFIVVLLVAAITAFSLPTFEYYRVSDLTVDEPSPRTYRLDQRYRIKDTEKTRKKRQQAMRNLTPQFVFENRITSRVLERIESRITAIRDSTSEVDFEVPDGDSAWDRASEIASLMAESLLDRGIIRNPEIFERLQSDNGLLVVNPKPSEGQDTVRRRDVNLKKFRNSIVDYENVTQETRRILSNLYPDYPYKRLVVSVLGNKLQPNVSFNSDKYQKQAKTIQKRIDPYYVTYDEGDVLLEADEVVQEKDIQYLKKINQQRFHFRLTNGAANFGLLITALVFLYFYLSEFNQELFSEHNKLALLAVISVIFVGLAKVVELIQVNLPNTLETSLPFAGPLLTNIEYAIPLAAPIMLATLLVSEGVAFLFAIFLALFVASFFSLQVELFAMFLLGGFAGIFSIRKVERRVTLLQSGFLIALVQGFIVLCLYSLRVGNPLTLELGALLIWSSLNGIILVPFTVLGMLPFLENGFGITTNFRLRELADLNHPLLRNLFQKAPGTFQHSVMLSNLCEQAARSIGANALLVRVGCYYHDLGKAENPEYFIENQEGIKNPHDELKPTLSASILKAHVKKGSQIANEAGLPQEIIDLIEQHHGTTLMKSFYHEVLKDTEDDANREEFQYPGPLPQTREAGICMLGDSVEAACRSLDDPTPQKIKERISEIVRNKFSEGQLNECDLTLRDLNTIISTFTRVLTSVYHRRIEYPDVDSPEEIEEHVEKLQSGDIETS